MNTEPPPEKTEAETAAQQELSALAVDLEQVRGRLTRIISNLGESRPQDVQDGNAPPSLAWRLRVDIDMMLEEYLKPAGILARGLAALTPKEVLEDWRAEKADRRDEVANDDQEEEPS